MVEITGFGGIAVNVWLVWILPFIGGAIIAGVARAGIKIRDYTAVGFALASAVSATTLIPLAFSNSEVHSQVNWIAVLHLKAGVLGDPLSVIMANLVAWISFLIFVYSTGYMHGERDLTRYWFFMLFFIGSMQLVVLSDNLLMLFFGWEGVGLASYALVGFWYTDRKKDFVGTEGHRAGGIAMWASPSHAGAKAFIMTKAGDTMMLAGMFLIFAYSGTFGFKELLQNQGWAVQMAHQNLLVPAAILLFGGAIGKSAQFPLNEWLLEAMTGPASVSALIHAATMVKAGVFLVARIAPLFFALAAFGMTQFFEVVAWVGAITAFLLASQAIANPEIKKVLAYSTGSQIGYMMMAIGIAGLSTNFAEGLYCRILSIDKPRDVQSRTIHGRRGTASRCWFQVYDRHGRDAQIYEKNLHLYVPCSHVPRSCAFNHIRILEQGRHICSCFGIRLCSFTSALHNGFRSRDNDCLLYI